MDWYPVVKTIHIPGSTILFGTSIGIAFFMFRSRWTNEMRAKLHISRNAVHADMLFTLPAVIVQPLSGAWLVWNGGYDQTEPWLLATYAVYVLVGLCWLPVVWIQVRLRDLQAEAVTSGQNLPDLHEKLFRLWFLLGWPAVIGLILVFYLMVAKPG